MALELALSETSICNMSLGRIGEKRLNNVATDTSTEAIQCRVHYPLTRDSLLRSHSWRFARARAELSEDTEAPPFEWDNQFILPADFLRFRSIYEEDGTTSRHRRHAIEDQRLLTDLSTVSLRYIKKVTDPAQFDPLFAEVLVLQLALKLIPALAGVGSAGQSLLAEIKRELYGSPRQPGLMSKVLAVNQDETDTGGRSDWNLARHGGIGIASEEERFW